MGKRCRQMKIDRQMLRQPPISLLSTHPLHLVEDNIPKHKSDHATQLNKSLLLPPKTYRKCSALKSLYNLALPICLTFDLITFLQHSSVQSTPRKSCYFTTVYLSQDLPPYLNSLPPACGCLDNSTYPLKLSISITSFWKPSLSTFPGWVHFVPLDHPLLYYSS